ncbi:MAG: hypothetical protein HPY78_01920 [Brevinematales bacterium]|nr:hypothetical protein [Brevinematales bacterium]
MVKHLFSLFSFFLRPLRRQFVSHLARDSFTLVFFLFLAGVVFYRYSVFVHSLPGQYHLPLLSGLWLSFLVWFFLNFWDRPSLTEKEKLLFGESTLPLKSLVWYFLLREMGKKILSLLLSLLLLWPVVDSLGLSPLYKVITFLSLPLIWFRSLLWAYSFRTSEDKKSCFFWLTFITAIWIGIVNYPSLIPLGFSAELLSLFFFLRKIFSSFSRPLSIYSSFFLSSPPLPKKHTKRRSVSIIESLLRYFLSVSEKPSLISGILVVIGILIGLGMVLASSPTLEKEQLKNGLILLWLVVFVGVSSLSGILSSHPWWFLCRLQPIPFWRASLLSQVKTLLVLPLLVPFLVWSSLVSPLDTLFSLLCGLLWVETTWSLHFLIGERPIFEAIIFIFLFLGFLIGEYALSWGFVPIALGAVFLLWKKAKQKYTQKWEDVP